MKKCRLLRLVLVLIFCQIALNAKTKDFMNSANHRAEAAVQKGLYKTL
jgi:hypothetical protein